MSRKRRIAQANRVHRRRDSRMTNHSRYAQRKRTGTMRTVQVQKPNLTDEEIRYAIKKLGREPNEVEWAMLEAQWSEHCSYKSSKPLLRLLPSKGPRVIVGPGSDA